jgi:hypothetical protein
LSEIKKQEQRAEANALAIQSGRDTKISHGLTRGDMKQIIEALAAQLPAYAATAREIVDARLKDFEQRVLERFSDPIAAHREAFRDPDFQYLVRRAQHAYARSGDEIVRDTLVDLIAQRSKQSDRNRLSLSLNEAVEKAAVLTADEFAELSLTYLFKHTINRGLGTLDHFVSYLQANAVPLLKDVSEEAASYTYLEAQSCASISIGFVDLRKVFRVNYGGLLAKGFTQQQLMGHLPDGQKDIFEGSGLVIPCLNDRSHLQFRALNKDVFVMRSRVLGVSPETQNNVWAMFEGTMWSDEEMIINLTPTYQRLSSYFAYGTQLH